MKSSLRFRRIIVVILALAGIAVWLVSNPRSYEQDISTNASLENGATEPLGADTDANNDAPLAIEILEKLEIKGRAPKTGYKRTEFYTAWPTINGCSLRQIIIKREVGENAVLAENGCDVIQGTFTESYTGATLSFSQKADFSKGIQIDHIVALSDAWQKGAQYKTADERYAMATDPLNLIAADASANQQKSDGDAATWLPSNKTFRCQYVARQISVKYKYGLWVTQAEHDAIVKVLESCPSEPVIGV